MSHRCKKLVYQLINWYQNFFIPDICEYWTWNLQRSLTPTKAPSGSAGSWSQAARPRLDCSHTHIIGQNLMFWSNFLWSFHHIWTWKWPQLKQKPFPTWLCYITMTKSPLCVGFVCWRTSPDVFYDGFLCLMRPWRRSTFDLGVTPLGQRWCGAIDPNPPGRLKRKTTLDQCRFFPISGSFWTFFPQ